LSDIATEILSVAALAVALLGAIVRPMGLSEAAFALPGALIWS
jgi:predicted membrane protein